MARADDRAERLRRFLADLYGVRIVDVEADDVLQLRNYLDKHGFLIVEQSGVIS